MLTNVLINSNGVLECASNNGSASTTITQDQNELGFTSLKNIYIDWKNSNIVLNDGTNSAGILKANTNLELNDQVIVFSSTTDANNTLIPDINSYQLISIDNVTINESSVVPELTSNISTNGTVSGNLGSADINNAYKLFTSAGVQDGSLTSDIPNSYIVYEFPADVGQTVVSRIFLELDQYNIHVIVEGAFEQDNYTTLFDGTIQDKEINIPIPGAYIKYKITIVDNPTGGIAWKKIILNPGIGDISDISSVFSEIPLFVIKLNKCLINDQELQLINSNQIIPQYDNNTDQFEMRLEYQDIQFNPEIININITFKFYSPSQMISFICDSYRKPKYKT